MWDEWGTDEESVRRQMKPKLHRLRQLLEERTPDSAVKFFREQEGSSLRQFAKKAEVDSGLLSKIESGHRKMTLKTAGSLAAKMPFPISGEQLMLLQDLGELKQGLATKSANLDAGTLDMLLQMAIRLDETLPQTDYTDRLIAVLVEVVQEGLAALDAPAEVATKSAESAARSTRDAHGRQTAKAFGLEQGRLPSRRDSRGFQKNKRFGVGGPQQPEEGPRRRADGTKINKPYDPPKWR